MGHESPSATTLAELVLAAEQGIDPKIDQHQDAVSRTFDKLNVHLSDRLGSAGYRALLERAVVTAAVEHPVLISARVREEGDIEGIASVTFDASIAILARLIELLDTFIGRNLTARILHGVWPDVVPASWQGERNG
jgi:hypothetical protein